MEDTSTQFRDAGAGAALRPPRLASVSAECPAVAPGILLAAARGRPRGYWSRDGRWTVHIGAAAEVATSHGEGAKGEADPRWTLLRERIDGLFGEIIRDDGPAGGRPRLLGGLAFHPDPREDPRWAGFAPARFLLPEIEVTGGDGEETRVAVTAPIPPRGDAEDGRARARRRLGDLRRSLAATATTRQPEPPAGLDPPGGDAAREGWTEAVEEILRRIREEELEKAVLARALDLAGADALDPAHLVLRLEAENPSSSVFLVEPAPGSALVGAAPEIIAAVDGRRFRHTAVAGSARRDADGADDERLGRELLESAKDRAEHEVCVRDAVERLRGRVEELDRDAGPHLLKLAGIQHLETRLEGRVPPGTGLLSLVEALHPTPAVCGYPRDRARRLLREVEPFERGWYAGPVGWLDGDGDGCFVPALRSAVIQGERIRLFAGSGIVEGSEPATEWEETALKFEPVLRALGVR